MPATLAGPEDPSTCLPALPPQPPLSEPRCVPALSSCIQSGQAAADFSLLLEPPGASPASLEPGVAGTAVLRSFHTVLVGAQDRTETGLADAQGERTSVSLALKQSKLAVTSPWLSHCHVAIVDGFPAMSLQAGTKPIPHGSATLAGCSDHAVCGE